jgi:hypothetical protein
MTWSCSKAEEIGGAMVTAIIGGIFWFWKYCVVIILLVIFSKFEIQRARKKGEKCPENGHNFLLPGVGIRTPFLGLAPPI